MTVSSREHEDAKQLQQIFNAKMEEETQSLLQSYSEGRQKESQVALEQINSERVRLEDAIAFSKKAEAEIREDARVRIESMREKHIYEIQKTKDASVSNFVVLCCIVLPPSFYSMLCKKRYSILFTNIQHFINI